MKTKFIQIGISLFLWISILLLVTSCAEEDCHYSYTYYEPIFMSYDEFRSLPIDLQQPRELQDIGRIYFYNNYLFINERNEGIHIIDNRNPSLPRQIGFLSIKGNVDLAIADNILYADSYTDLLVINIASIQSPKLVKRIEMAFKNQIFGNGGYADPTHGIVVDWEAKEIVTEYACDEYVYYDDNAFDGGGRGESGNGAHPNGIGGAMARFTLSQNHLYALNGDELISYAIQNAANPIAQSQIYLGWGVETLFPYGNHLFIGSQRGMHIYALENTGVPSFISTYEHITSCDPVAVEGNIAYVTLRTGNTCQNGVNQLQTIDISDIRSPRRIGIKTLYNPHGLAVDNKIVFVCDAQEGLKVIDATNPQYLQQIGAHGEINAFDVIAHQNLLILIGKDGLYQYEYQSPSSIRLLSVIPTK